MFKTKHQCAICGGQLTFVTSGKVIKQLRGGRHKTIPTAVFECNRHKPYVVHLTRPGDQLAL